MYDIIILESMVIVLKFIELEELKKLINFDDFEVKKHGRSKN